MVRATSTPQMVIRRITEILKRRYRPEQMILFGSYAAGTTHKDSDIDLLVVKTTTKPFFRRLVEVRRLVAEARRGYPFDPVVLTPVELKHRLAIGDQFLRDILQHGRVLYGH